MLNNKADVIEDYILSQLRENRKKQVELKRTELADMISCAPSQVTYVLSTRFTNDRGFKVESQRGLGGYIRITIIDDSEDEKNLLYTKILDSITEKTTFDEVKLLLDLLLKKQIITVREAEIAAQTSISLYALEKENLIAPESRAYVIQSIFETFSKIT